MSGGGGGGAVSSSYQHRTWWPTVEKRRIYGRFAWGRSGNFKGLCLPMAVLEQSKPSTFRGGPLTLSHWALLDPLGKPWKTQQDGRMKLSFISMWCLSRLLLKACFTLFCTAMVTGGLHRNNHQSGIIPDHFLPVSSYHPPFKTSQERKQRMILAEIRGNFLWKGE